MPYEAFEKTIEDWSLKLTIPYETNDPFEFMPRCQNLNNIINKQILTAKNNPPGMLCFSTSMTSASMWGHYADRHKGVCLIFDFPCVTEMLPITSRTDTIRSYVIGKYENLKNSPDPKLLIFPVIYSTQRPPSIQRHKYDASGGHDFGQLMRRYHKPTFVIAFDESGVGKGSGRSIPGVSLVQAIHHCADTLVSGGGHDMAAGLVIEESRMDDFRRAFNRYVSETTTEEQRSPVLNIDMEVSFQALTLDLLDSYEKLEPFGNSNPQPLFMSSDVFPTEPPKRVGTNHLKLFMRQGIVERDAIFFNGAERELPNPPWDIAFTIDRNVYRGRASLSISIQEIRSHREM